MKNYRHWIRIFLFVLFIAAFNSRIAAAAEGHTVYLTWQKSPENSMTIHWISMANDAKSEVSYSKEGSEAWLTKTGTRSFLPEGHDEYLVHTVELKNLAADAKYHFRLGNKTPIYAFKTMPAALDQPLRFVVGGDMYHDSIEAVAETCVQAANCSPRFAILGGDLAYATKKDTSSSEDMHRWLKLLQIWEETMVTPDGIMVPILPTISNEDTKGRYNQTADSAAFFYALFSFPGYRGYSVLDFGNYLSIWLLDTGHTNPIDGKQAFWLRESLKSRYFIPFKFAAYHVGAYPSVRPLQRQHSLLIRKHWIPSFDKYKLLAGFEHHDHAYKRTKPLRNNRVDPKGTIYLGDGCWGITEPRIPAKANDRWYLDKTACKRHFHLVSISAKGWEQIAIDHEGSIIDQSTHHVKVKQG